MKGRIVGAGLCLLILAAGLSLAAEAVSPPRGDPFRGRELLDRKLCVQCHSVWGQGGTLGPDIPTVIGKKSWLDLVGDFWNHTPSMISAMSGRGHAWPTVTHEEMTDLLSYLYYLRLFDAPGDPVAGSIAYSQMRCADCHTLGRSGGQGGGPLDMFSAFPSPVMLAQAMWNAGPAMQQYQIGHGTPIPRFLRNEMADIQAFIRSRALRTEGDVALMPLPDPVKGGEVFRAKRCGACHRPTGREAPDLSDSVIDMTATEISGSLWNHSYAMNDRMRARGIPFPIFKGSEMSDLIAYLHFLGFSKGEGNPARGETVAREKGCLSCHDGPDSQVKRFAGNPSAGDPIALSAAMWNHAPEMHRLMAQRSVAWPKFNPGEMGDLATYLRGVAAGGRSPGN